MYVDVNSWPFIRAAVVCVICQRAKPVGKFVCDSDVTEILYQVE